MTFVRFVTVAWLALLVSPPVARAATPAPPGVRVFALTYMTLDEGSTLAGYSQLSVTSAANAAASITIPSANVSEYSLLRSTNDLTTEYVTDSVTLHNSVSEDITDRAVIVVTQDTADVFGSRFFAASGDAFHALPLTVNGRSFYIPSLGSTATGKSFYGIAAASTTCVLQVYYFTDAGQFVLQESISLAYGEVFQRYAPTGNVDYTGLYVTSAAPVAVFSGHECAQNPPGTRYCDHLVDQIPAVRFWGNMTLVPPVAGRNADAGYTVRILSQQDTTISFPYSQARVQYRSGCDSLCTVGSSVQSCTSPCMIGRGRHMEVRVTDASTPVTVVCSVACLVVQYGHSLETSATTEINDPDPFMAVITPVDHYVNPMSYLTPSYYDGITRVLTEYVNFLTMVVLSSDLSGLRLDDTDPTTGASVITTTQGAYTVLSMPVAHGKHVISHADPNKRVMAFPVGHAHLTVTGASTSYRFSAGYEIDDLTIPGDWAEVISIPDGVFDPDVTTEAPRVCVHSGSSSALTVSFVLRGVDVEADVVSCDSSLGPVLPTLLTQINQAICERVICPNVPDDVYVKAMQTDVVNGTLQITVDLTNSLDATAMSMVECRVHIGDYMRRPEFWSQASLGSDNLATCYDAIVTLEKIQNIWECPVDSLG